MEIISVILYLVAFACFLLAAAGVPLGRLNLIGLGLACWLAGEHVTVAAH